MSSKSLWVMIVLAFLLVIFSFVLNFHTQSISDELQDWNNFGGYGACNRFCVTAIS